MPAKIAYSGCF